MNDKGNRGRKIIDILTIFRHKTDGSSEDILQAKKEIMQLFPELNRTSEPEKAEKEVGSGKWYLPVKIGQEPERAGNTQVWCQTKQGEDYIYVDPAALIPLVRISNQAGSLKPKEGE